MIKRVSLLTALCVLFFTPVALCESAASLFAQAKEAQADGKKDMAFLLYRQILRQYPSSQYTEESHFLIGQYYYDSRNYFDANQSLRSYLREFPRSRFSQTANEYLSRIRLVSLKERADRLFEEANLGPASVLYQQYLEIDRDNAEVKAQLELIKRTQQQVHFGFEQLNRDRRKFQQEKDALDRQVAALEQDKKQVTALQKQALELNKVTTENYEKKIAAISARMEELNKHIGGLEKELQGWRERAIIAEAARLSRPFPKGLKPLPQAPQLPRIAFHGKKADPSPEEGETEVADIVREGFPAVVITQAKLDDKKNLHHVEAVVSVDLTSLWPEGAKLKFRVDFVGKQGQPPPKPQLLVTYFDASDMDEMEEITHSYRKRVAFNAQEKLTERYDVSVFFVKSK